MKLEGLMQHDTELTTAHILGRMRSMNADAEVVTLRNQEGHRDRIRYGELAERTDLLAHGLATLGIEAPDRIGTLLTNTQEHLECYLGVPTMGAVLHTLNHRLSAEQLAYVIEHGGDRVIILEAALVPVLAPIAGTLSGVETYVVVGDADGTARAQLPDDRTLDYEDLLASAHGSGAFPFPALDDRAAAALCYTSGTTGDPKGVLYSHRSCLLFALSLAAADSMGISRDDRVLPVVPMFHANAWGTPFTATLVGADLILPSRFLGPAPLARLIEDERATLCAGVPTVFMDLLRYADDQRPAPDLSSLRAVPCGGSAVPISLIDGFRERHGVRIVQAWGMTEMSPVGSVAWPPAGAEGERRRRYESSQGRPSPFIEMRLVGDDGEEVPWDGESTGELQTRGPWVARSYFREEGASAKFADGWLRTGDVAAITPDGYIRITDRSKDVIKSGGEWISSVELENELMGHPDVIEAAVIARPDERWGERPLACVVLRPGALPDPDGVREHLAGAVPKWWLPEEVAFIDEVPKTSVGKFDKKRLRARFADGDLRAAPGSRDPSR